MKSLFKALDIIEALAETSGMGIRELAVETGLPPATTHRIVNALVEREFLQKTGNPPRYALAPKFLMLADAMQPRNEVALVTRPYLEKLMQLTGENANLCIRDGWDAIYIEHVSSRRHDLRIFTRIGARAPLYATGVGKVFLAGMSSDLLQTYLQKAALKRLTPHTITDSDRLLAEVLRIRKRGYSVDDQEKEPGVRCIAAPLFNYRGEIDAAISISGPAQRITTDRLSELAEMVKKTAADVSRSRGYRTRKKTT